MLRQGMEEEEEKENGGYEEEGEVEKTKERIRKGEKDE